MEVETEKRNKEIGVFGRGYVLKDASRSGQCCSMFGVSVLHSLVLLRAGMGTSPNQLIIHYQ